jgi:predicted permease
MPKSGEFERRYLLLALRIAGDFGVTIALPVVVMAALGKRLDLRYGTWPLLTALGFLVAAALTAYLIRQKAKRYATEYEAIIAADHADRDARKIKSPRP